MIDVATARGIVLRAAAPLAETAVGLGDAVGRVSARAVAADRDSPPTDRSAMDGFAVRTADLPEAGRTLRVSGEVRAGRSARGIAVGPGEAVRIFTGAPVPEGADAVVMVELTEEDRAAGTIRVGARPSPGDHIRRRGEERRAGEEVLAKGTVLRAAEIAALAAVGCDRVPVVRPPSVAVLSTGDEVVPPGVAPAPHQVRNANARMLLARLAEMRLPATDLGIVADEEAALDAAIARGLAHDALILTGGVSVGAYDLVGDALGRAGCDVLVHGVAMRPGKPVLAARKGAVLVFGLPGNPVSAFTAFHVLAAPALRALSGDRVPVRPTVRARLGARLKRKPGRAIYALARLEIADGAATVLPVESASSGDVLALSRANAFVVAEGDPHAIEAGEAVDVEPWAWGGEFLEP